MDSHCPDKEVKVILLHCVCVCMCVCRCAALIKYCRCFMCSPWQGSYQQWSIPAPERLFPVLGSTPQLEGKHINNRTPPDPYNTIWLSHHPHNTLTTPPDSHNTTCPPQYSHNTTCPSHHSHNTTWLPQHTLVFTVTLPQSHRVISIHNQMITEHKENIH